MAAVSTDAQRMPGGAPPTPNFGGAMVKLFGDNSSFSATLELRVKPVASEEPMQMQGKLACLEGKSRFEVDMSKITSSRIPPAAAAQMQSMGLSQMVMISRPDKSLNCLVYPNLKAYVEMPMQDADAAKSASDFKIETTELGKETVDGHPCVKNKAVVTDSQGNKHESTVWNATDLRSFPVKIEMVLPGTGESSVASTMLFKDISFSKPEAGLFDPPNDFTKYDSMMAMMQQEMMKHMGQQRPPHSP